ncbi:senescence-induced receptor-like serine/threonine-protein kinase isoform X2 [Olea europaea var. sylvestris]|uniref:senescence-induced receptor-like serine/threonine-protein kinase isoform X2 n=1 Tax=Olea europaea var. sylvestris TaxID=158386 RepID=UPI000C1CF8A2|nr:senescence-induced receptor-like serine/threonine-protein kinase isoform X2 [Olea europaea var. sylvestris]
MGSDEVVLNVRRVLDMLKFCLVEVLVGFALVAVLVQTQTHPLGYISIDCGLENVSNYNDATTGIYYTSDAEFINSGINQNILPEYKTTYLDRHFLTLRSFPEGTKNCYTLKPVKWEGNKYLIRVRFMYGNYDNKSQLPEFDLYLGVNFWDTVIFDGVSTSITKEIIHIVKSDFVHVCLMKTGVTTPIISAVELRPLAKTLFPTQIGSLKLYARLRCGSITYGQQTRLRYRDDPYDRIWTPFFFQNSLCINTTETVSPSRYRPPSEVMSTAWAPISPNDSLVFNWKPENAYDSFYTYMYFAEIQPLTANQTREFSIALNDRFWNKSLTPLYLQALTKRSIWPVPVSSNYTLELKKSEKSTQPPILNAIELYTVKVFLKSETDDTDVTAILKIMSTYGLKRNWQGDPCEPEDFKWDGLMCRYNNSTSPRIISLNLSSSQLKGIIDPSMSNLKRIETLDLSNNNLIGRVPDFLTVLNLKGNNFTWPVSDKLMAKNKSGLLLLIIDDPPIRTSAKMNSILIPVPVLASVLAAVFGLLIVLVTLRIVKKRIKKARGRQRGYATPNRNGSVLVTRNREFTYSEVLQITNNFERVIGKGGFGTVYHGFVGDMQVAVKMLSPSSFQGYKEFRAEANLLTKIHHKNLTSLVGYCNEDSNMGIIYEYMCNGNLAKHLSGSNSYALSWEERLQIASGAAQGLDYLHHGCEQPIIHRDIKSTNILLDENFQAKLADFGLSRAFPVEGGSHISTVLAGTPGYLDPDYSSSNRLTEKSDVYSFGVVLLEIITGRPALKGNEEATHIVPWVNSMLPQGDVKMFLDPRIQDNFSLDSVWKLVELAMACVSHNAIERPTMTYAVMEIKECLAMVITHGETESDKWVRMIPTSLETSRLVPHTV